MASLEHLHRVQSRGGMIWYPLGSSGQMVVMTDCVLAHLAATRQLRQSDAEAGGQLFALFDGPKVIVQGATAHRPSHAHLLRARPRSGASRDCGALRAALALRW